MDFQNILSQLRINFVAFDSVNEFKFMHVFSSFCFFYAYSDAEEDLPSANSAINKEVLKDVGTWALPISARQRLQVVRRPVDFFTNLNGPFRTVHEKKPAAKGRRYQVRRGSPKSLQNSCNFWQRKLNVKLWFYRKLKNGQKVRRSWLVYSPSKGALFCFPCVLFYDEFDRQNAVSLFVKPGFTNWKKLNPKVGCHEASDHHQKCFSQWKQLRALVNREKGIDKDLERQIRLEADEWNKVLKRILNIVLFLAKQNLAFRGHREKLSDLGNNGNFLGLVKLLAVYDPVLQEHVNHVSRNPGSISYFSPQIQNELINILSEKVSYLSFLASRQIASSCQSCEEIKIFLFCCTISGSWRVSIPYMYILSSWDVP